MSYRWFDGPEFTVVHKYIRRADWPRLVPSRQAPSGVVEPVSEYPTVDGDPVVDANLTVFRDYFL